jgi:putative methionine-R-sulfoxide reductase with GAF domain
MNNASPTPSTSLDWLTSTLQAEREQLVNFVLALVTVMVSVLIVGNTLAIWLLGQEGLTLGPFVILPFILGPAYLWRHRLPFAVRAGLLVIPAIGVNVYDLYTVGLVGSGGMSLLVIAILWMLLLGTTQGALMLGVVGSILAVMGYQIYVGNIVPTADLQPFLDGSIWVGYAISFGLQAGLVSYLFNQLVERVQETWQRQQALRQTITAERDSLEERVFERTRGLSLTAEASRSMSNILDRNQLLLEVVDQIQKAFNYYHVHVYQVDEEQNFLIMSGGTGEAGKALLIGKHKLAMGQGLVGRAAQNKRPVFVPDVGQEVGWVPNPLLPETKAEIAVPIILGGQLLGVLDVQHNITNGLNLEDVVLLESLANQFAVSLRNTAIYEQAQNHARQAALVNQIGQKIQLSPDVNFTLQTAVREVGQALNANRVTINLDVQRFWNTPPAEEQST